MSSPKDLGIKADAVATMAMLMKENLITSIGLFLRMIYETNFIGFF
jgi:hypothetical protein